MQVILTLEHSYFVFSANCPLVAEVKKNVTKLNSILRSMLSCTALVFYSLDMKQKELISWKMYRSLAFSIYPPALLMAFCQSIILLTLLLFALELGGGASVTDLVLVCEG